MKSFGVILREFVWLRGPLKIFEGHTDEIYGLCFNPTGTLLFSASADKTMKVWEPHTGDLVNTFTGHTDDVNCVIATSNGVAITGSADQSVKKWIIDTATCVGTFFKFLILFAIATSLCD